MKHIFLDMDGTLNEYTNTVHFNKVVFEPGFFSKKRPLWMVLYYLQDLEAEKYIISASPSEIHDDEKYKWLKRFCPFVPTENIIITRWQEENKMDRLEQYLDALDLDRDDVYLIDDEHEYLRQAEKMGINPIHTSRLIGMIERKETI